MPPEDHFLRSSVVQKYRLKMYHVGECTNCRPISPSNSIKYHGGTLFWDVCHGRYTQNLNRLPLSRLQYSVRNYEGDAHGQQFRVLKRYWHCNVQLFRNTIMRTGIQHHAASVSGHIEISGNNVGTVVLRTGEIAEN